jgi:tRNA threonylcarbamoyladenosine biosynthesis protein TsaB
MAVILSIESSTTVCSAALHSKGELLALAELHLPQSASSKLAIIIRDLFTVSGTSKSDVAAIAVSAGPGSYTGLRIGVALAKGMCFSLSIPLISINTLELLAHQVRSNGVQGIFCPMIDARRMEVYCLMMDQYNQIIEPTSATVVDENTFKSKLTLGSIYFFGNGSAKCKSIINHPNAIFLDNIVPSAAGMGQSAFKKFELHQLENLASFEPLYLKEFLVKKPKEKN